MIKKLGIMICGALIPLQAGALQLIDDFEVPQGATVKLIVPKFDFIKIEGNFDGKTIPFYETAENIDTQSPITRAEFLKIIYQNRNTKTDCECEIPKDFEDAPNNSEFYPAIKYATVNGFVHGYEDGLFHPFEKITRGQASKIIMNAYNPEQTITDIPFFADIPPDYSLRDFVYDSVRAGVFKGYPDGLMRPDKDINFLEAKLIIERASKLENITIVTERPVFRAFLGIHRLSETGTTPINLNLTDIQNKTSIESANVSITKQNFATQWFNLAPSKTELFGKDYQDNTWKLINEAKLETHDSQLWKGAFEKPTTGKITLGFGDKLYINGAYSGSHFGIDYADKEGTPVWASNSGIITMAGETPAYGNTIIIDHGQNIFTMYLHLHELKVKKGDAINKNDLIATMGQTGIATGPHLHFSHFIGDIIVDSQPWFEGKFL